MLTVPSAEIHWSRLVMALPAAQPSEHLRKGAVAMARRQQPNGIPGRSLTAM